jgi:hypothetical protein
MGSIYVFENVVWYYERRCYFPINPKKSVFEIDEGKFLGHVASKGGISIDPERVQSIKYVLPPTNKKSLQSFFGKINFIRRFLPNFSERIKPMSALLKKALPLNGMIEPSNLLKT